MKRLTFGLVMLLCCALLPLKANDACADANPIDCGQTLFGSTIGATFDNVGTCGTTNTAPGVWFTYIAATDAVVSATTCDAANYDTKISVFEGTCGALVCVDGGDDDFGCTDILTSTATFPATTGTTYWILVHGFAAEVGDFQLSLTCAGPSANDSPCDAVAVDVDGSADFDNTGASADPGEVNPGGGTVGPAPTCDAVDGWCSFETDVQNSVWFTFVAPASGCVSIGASGADYQLAVYSAEDCGDYSTFTEVGANDDGGPGLEPLLSPLSCLTPGETYYVQIDGFDGDGGPGVVTIVDCGIEPLACDAGGCQTRFVGYDPADTANYLTVDVTGGFPPYFYTWSGPNIDPTPDSEPETIGVNPDVTSTYTVVVTDASGCTTTCSVVVNVIDVTCGKKGNKVTISHAPGGNPDNCQTLCVSPNAVPSHLGEHGGDRLGPCDNECLATNPPPAPCADLEIFVTTDAFGEEVQITLIDQTEGFIIGQIPFFTFPSNGTFLVTGECLNPTHCYELVFEDGFGDGICCAFGNGGYFYTFDGDTTFSPSGGAYGAGESTTFGGGCVAPRLAKDEAATTITGGEATITAFPNPFASTTNIQFVSDVDVYANLHVMDMSGKLVDVLFEGNVTTGDAVQTTFNAGDKANGMYIYRLQLGENVYHGKLILAR